MRTPPSLIGKGIVLFRVRRHMERAEGQHPGFYSDPEAFPFDKIKQHQAYLSRIGGVSYGKLQAQPSLDI